MRRTKPEPRQALRGELTFAAGLQIHHEDTDVRGVDAADTTRLPQRARRDVRELLGTLLP